MHIAQAIYILSAQYGYCAAICILHTRSLDIGIMRTQYAYCAGNIYIECAVWLLRGNKHIAYTRSLDIGIMRKQSTYAVNNRPFVSHVV